MAENLTKKDTPCPLCGGQISTSSGCRLPKTDPLIFCGRECAEKYEVILTRPELLANHNLFSAQQRLVQAEIRRQQGLIHNPKHYNSNPSGIECITVAEHMSFCLGNVLKYVWRADLKNGVEDLKKARWYIDREIDRRSREDEKP